MPGRNAKKRMKRDEVRSNGPKVDTKVKKRQLRRNKNLRDHEGLRVRMSTRPGHREGSEVGNFECLSDVDTSHRAW